MTRFIFVIMFFSLLRNSAQRSTPEDDSYVAAVVEYQVQSNLATNIQNYLQLIQEAAEQNADVVVFPELTLSGVRSVPVPIYGLLQDYPIPALRPDLYEEILVSISAAAREREMYVVINIQEELDCTTDLTEETCPEARVYLFNTNVVFDRTGAVIDRYRKINLFGEFTRTPALQPDLGIFTTDFGVTFGHFICFDLQFQVPSNQIIQKHNLTDIIFTTMWYSELPYLTAVQLQEAYAYSLNVNFIGSGANNVRAGSAGSGIFSGRAGALVSTMPGLPATRLLVSRVPKVPSQVNFLRPGPIYDNPADHDNLFLLVDPSLPAHISRPLIPGFQELTLIDKEISCSFRISLEQREGETQYSYRAGAFSGVRTYSGLATGGTRICSVFSCTGEDIATCGRRFPTYSENTTMIFDELTITASVPTPVMDPALEAYDSAFFPVSLGVSIMPLAPEEYTFSVNELNATTEYTISLNNNNAQLYSLAIWGRVFALDGEEVSPPIDESADTTIDSTIAVTDATNAATDSTNGVTDSPDSSISTDSPLTVDNTTDSSVINFANKIFIALAVLILIP